MAAVDAERTFNYRGWLHYKHCLVARYPIDEYDDGFPWCTCLGGAERGPGRAEVINQ